MFWSRVGVCRRYPPNVFNHYPPTDEHQWCGEWKQAPPVYVMSDAPGMLSMYQQPNIPPPATDVGGLEKKGI